LEVFIAKKAKKEKPFGACNYCWQLHPAEDTHEVFVPTTHVPDIIIVVERASQLSGSGGRLLKSICDKANASPIFVSARVCDISGVVPLEEIKRNREAILLPLLASHTLPVVALGLGASFVAGGKCTETSMVNKVLTLYDRVCAFTYDIDEYLYRGRNSSVLEHIETTIKSALTPISRPSWTRGFLPETTNLVVDVETTGVEFPWYGSKMIQIGIKEVEGNSYVYRPSDFSPEDKKYLADNTKLIVGHNIAFDMIHLAYEGIHFPNAKVHDTMIYHKNAYPNEAYYGLKPLAKKYFGFPHWDAWFASRYKNEEPINVDDDDEWRQLCDYNVFDLHATEQLYLSQRGKYTTQFALEMDYLKYVHKMIMNGMHVDKDKLEVLYGDISKQAEVATEEAKRSYGLGIDFNFNSPAQVLSLLRTYDNSISGTGADVLVDFLHIPAVGSLSNIRDLSKLKGTGLEGLKSYLDSDSLVHSSIAVHGAETGRSSSSSPNLQNTDPRVRGLFTSRYLDGRLVHTDLSGIEYRLIAHASEDKVLLDVFNGGKDIHDEMYLALFGEYPPDKKLRKKAKTANFCGVYGGGYKKFLLSTELPDSAESKHLFKLVSGRYPGVAAWKERVIRDLRRTRWIRNLFGRTRKFDTINMDVEREAINWIIQSSGHDILKIYSMALCDMIQEAGYEKTLLCSEVHDSNTFDSPGDEYARVFDLISSLAKNLNPLILQCFDVKMRVPILADTEIMERWS
jgi:DNA polymerase I-like protein with 3'-5' exonuclease and polymerase domains